MLQGAVVKGPDGHRWRVGRRWTDRSLPDLRERFKSNSELGAAEGGVEALWALDLVSSPGSAIAVAVGAFLLCVVLLPLIGIAFELIVLAVLIWSGTVARVFLGRPWIVEAIDLDDGSRSAAFPVKGWRGSGRAVEVLERAITTNGVPTLLKSS